MKTKFKKPLFEFDGQVLNADRIDFISSIQRGHVDKKYYFNGNILSFENKSKKKLAKMRAKFIKLWNKNLTRGK